MKFFSFKKKDRDKQKSGFANVLASTLATTSKQLIWIFSINGIAWIWCSYILAFMGKDQIAEALSGNVCTVIIGQMGCYLITKTVENVFQYNDIFGPKANGIIAPPPTYETPTIAPIVQTVSSSVTVSQDDTEITSQEEISDESLANQLDLGAAPIPEE